MTDERREKTGKVSEGQRKLSQPNYTDSQESRFNSLTISNIIKMKGVMTK